MRCSSGIPCEQIAVDDAGIEGDAQVVRHVGQRAQAGCAVACRRGDRRDRCVRNALALDEHRRPQRPVPRNELVDLAGDLRAARRQRLGGHRRIGKRESHASLLVRRSAQIGFGRSQRAAYPALVHDALVLLLDLHEHAVVGLRRPVAAQAQLLLVQRLVQRPLDERALGRVEVAADDARPAERVGCHATAQRGCHRAVLARIQAVLHFLAFEYVGERCHGIPVLSIRHRILAALPESSLKGPASARALAQKQHAREKGLRLFLSDAFQV